MLKVVSNHENIVEHTSNAFAPVFVSVHLMVVTYAKMENGS
jgi:hypothetical protein